MMSNISASAKLEGLTLTSGWKVTRTIGQDEDSTGGTFSHAYVVSKEGKEGFLKAFDFSDAFRRTSNVLEELNRLTNAYIYERDLLIHCREKRLRKVIVAIEHGEVQVPNYDAMNGRVFYLIFHLAEGDIRRQITQKGRFDRTWCMRALTDVTIGMHQVHRQMIAHQDLKPSNILVFPDECRVGDFGRASRKEYAAGHDLYNIAGDRTYAPPEQLYGYCDPEWTTRRFGCDLYMLGNLAAFLFTGVNVTSLLLGHLDQQFHPSVWARSYQEAMPYLQRSYGEVMREIGRHLQGPGGAELEVVIRELCNPDLSKRGSPKGIGRYDQYSLQRYVSRLDLIGKRLDHEMRQLRKRA
jgi:eukaryotic-like serine/threonine-protein kinase